MAYAVLSSLAQTIHQILSPDQYVISDDEKQQITLLREQVIFLREFLEKSPKQAGSLEARIRDGANRAEDLLENFMYEQVFDYYKSSNNIPRPLYGLKKAMEKINSISREAADFKTGDTPPRGNNPTPPTSSSTPPAPPDGGVAVGLDEDMMKIAELLCRESSKREIIPIVGMGGIGKTTLARKAFDHPLIMERFSFRAWVTVSQDYNPQNLFEDLLDSFKVVGDDSYGNVNDSLQDKLHKFLKWRRYLIVLDDIWNKEVWDDVSHFFPDDNNGSRIVITTRLEDVASYVDSSIPLHHMSLMDADQSWDLFKKKVFPRKDCPSGLEEIGKEIVKRCGGLPLAVVLVAGILCKVSENRLSWKEVAEKVDLAGESEKIISLSYNNLPHHLRACFLYMGGFPRNYEIRVSRLIKLWMAELFIEPRGGKSMEEVAIEYLEDLIKRNLVLVTEKKFNDGIKKCNVHDLVRDICRSRAEKENFQRRLSISHPDPMFLARAHVSSLRSVIWFYPSEASLGALRHLRLLRVLDVVDANVSSLPAQVYELFHLRYLSFSCVTKVPIAISRLRNLRTLIICSRKRSWRYSKDVLYLPLGIWMMRHLTHLVSSFDALLPDPEGVASPLEKLVTLSVVRWFVCTKEITQMVPNLKRLGITYFGEGNHEQDCQLHNLVLLHQLENLKLVLLADSIIPIIANPVFPQTLKKLTLSGWKFPMKYMEILGSLPNLQVLKLRDYALEGHTWETNEGQFPNLEFLHIDESYLRKWITEASHFPRLKHLALYRCHTLSEIPDDIGEIPTLQMIEFDGANMSLVKCIQRIQEEQHNNGNYDLQVRPLSHQRASLLMKIVIQLLPSEGKIDRSVAFTIPDSRTISNLRIPASVRKIDRSWDFTTPVSPSVSKIDRSLALRILASVPGVYSVGLNRYENDRLVIIGYHVDVDYVTNLLTERFGCGLVVSTEPVKV